MYFDICFINVVLTLLFIVPGYILCKVKKAKAEHLSTMSAVLIFVGTPCLIVSAFLSFDYTPEKLLNMGIFFGVTLVLQALFIFILWLFLRKKHADARYRIFNIGCVFGNVGFFGLPIIRALFPYNPEVACYSSTYVVSMNILVFTVGTYCLTGDKKFMSLKQAFINPSTIGLIVALPLFIFGAKTVVPDYAYNAVKLLGDMTAPFCMIILGVRLATVPFTKLFTRPFVYLICVGKLIVFPLFCFAAVYFLPIDYAFKASILVLSAVPCASIMLNLAEIHNGETELAANCVLLSTLLCFITIPLLTLLL